MILFLMFFPLWYTCTNVALSLFQQFIVLDLITWNCIYPKIMLINPAWWDSSWCSVRLYFGKRNKFAKKKKKSLFECGVFSRIIGRNCSPLKHTDFGGFIDETSRANSAWRKKKILFSQRQKWECTILEEGFKKMTQETYPIMNFIQVMGDKFYLIDIFHQLNILLSYTVCQVINIEILTSMIKIVDGRLFF